ncbi:MAG: hypothetical protein F6K47_19400 [Symploca sp. SIO2E6]|nr:hypothetical protein [Symploca sp. SIO2E6]
MNQPQFIKNLPVPVRMLFRPMLLISLGLHALVLMLPTSFDPNKAQPPKKEDAIKITKLPPAVKPSPETSPQSSPQPTTQPILQRSQSTPRQTTTNIPQSTVPSRYQEPRYQQTPYSQQQQRPIPQEPRSQQLPYSHQQQQLIPEEPGSQQAPYSHQQQQLIQEVNQPEPTSNQQESPPPENPISPQPKNNPPQTSEIPDPSREFFEKFPRYPGATPGSAAVLRQDFEEAAYIFHTEDDLQTVAAKFEKELLPNDDFSRPKTKTNSDDFKVYEVSTDSGDETKYLHLISKDGKIAIYLESDEYSLNELMELKIEDNREYFFFSSHISTAIGEIAKTHNLEDFDSEEERNLLNEKDIFDDKIFNFTSAKKTRSSDVTPKDIAKSLDEQLQISNKQLEADQKFEKLSEEGQYGKGNLLYLVKNSKFKSYVTLAPATDDQGQRITVIILSQEDPRKN